jgi:hypothetical protein
MATEEIVVLGDKLLLMKLAKLGPAGRKVARKASREVAKGLQTRVQAAAPVKSGTLRKQMKIRALKGRGNDGAVVRTGTREEMGIAPGAEHYYPAALMYGHGNVAAVPFMLLATEQYRPLGQQMFRRLLARGIEGAAR